MRQKKTPELLPPAFKPDWMLLRNTPVEEVADVLHLEPTIVGPDVMLDEVAEAMLAHPNVHVACVVGADGRLMGLLSLRALADDLFFHIMPEEFLSETTDLEGVMSFADKICMRTAVDAMQAPIWVKRSEKVKDAFKRMHKHGLPGLPIVDERYHVIGYINLLELLTLCLKRKGETGGLEATP